jgi:hypothetical protein
MTAKTDVKTVSAQPSDFEQKVEKLRKIYADASDISRAALENVIRALGSEASATASPTEVDSAGRIGASEGKVSELTAILPLRPGGAKRMRAFLALHGNLGNRNVDLVGTVHDMRWVFLDNDTKVLFASTYDGDWDPYIDDFGTKIPDILDLQFGEVEGWPGIRSPEIKNFIVKHQIQAHFWYVANPNLTVVETKELEKRGKALDEFLDKVA